MATFAARAEAAVRGSGGRITRSRRALFAVLEEEDKPLAPLDLQRRLARRGARMDRVSLYRNLGALLELGLVHRVLGSTAVRRCAEEEPRCHHAIVCTRCGNAREFHSAALERALSEVRRATGYRVQGHTLELRGLCSRCKG